jgi:hypothetical protein
MARAGANSGSYFRAVIELSIVTQDILTSLYAAGTNMRSGGDSQQEIRRLGQLLDKWITSLPSEFNFQTQNETQQPYLRERTVLGFHFYSARILITRLCFGGLGQNVPESFVQSMANTCIESAQAIVGFLPDQPNASALYASGPWWSVVHSLMQATSVFLLALTSSTATSVDTATLSIQVKKVIRWLREMHDPLAVRASHMVLHIFQTVAVHFSIDISDLLIFLAGYSETSMEQNEWVGGVDTLTLGLDGHLQAPYMGGAARAGSGFLPFDRVLMPFSPSSRDGPSFTNPF